MSTDPNLPAERRERVVAVLEGNDLHFNLFDTAKFEHLWRISNAFAKSELVPKIFQQKPENCFVALQAAFRMGVDPFMFLQSCYVVGGKPSIEAKLAIALLNTSGKIRGSLSFSLSGEGMKRQCICSAMDRETGEVHECCVSMADAKAEGWIDKQGSKWKTIPDLMLQYRSAAWLIRVHYPEVIMGMQTREENEDTALQTVDVVTEQPRMENKRVQPVEMSKPNGTKGHSTTCDFRSIDIPGEVIELLARAVVAGDSSRVDEIIADASASADEELRGRLLVAQEAARGEVERKTKKQGTLV